MRNSFDVSYYRLGLRFAQHYKEAVLSIRGLTASFWPWVIMSNARTDDLHLWSRISELLNAHHLTHINVTGSNGEYPEAF